MSDTSGQAPARRRNILLGFGYYTHDRHAGIVRYAREAGWSLDCRLLAFRASEARHLQYLHSAQYDGAITYLTNTAPQISRLIRSFGMPVVDLGMDQSEWALPRVLPDNIAIGRLGADYLLGRGFERLIYYAHYLDTPATRLRMSGFKEKAESRNTYFYPLIWNERPRREKKKKDRLQWLADKLLEQDTPLAVMAINDYIAAEVLQACELVGLRVPEQVAVLGVDNEELVTEFAPVPISSIDSNRERIGYEAAALLDRLIDGHKSDHKPILITPKGVVTRKSTDILAVQDKDVAIALHFIWGNFKNPIGVDDVVKATCLSRRHLQDRFQDQIGRTLYEEITWQRVQFASKLLEMTDDKVLVIASQSGFGSAERMSKVFVKVLGLNPRDYRQRHRNASINRQAGDSQTKS